MRLKFIKQNAEKQSYFPLYFIILPTIYKINNECEFFRFIYVIFLKGKFLLIPIKLIGIANFCLQCR